MMAKMAREAAIPEESDVEDSDDDDIRPLSLSDASSCPPFLSDSLEDIWGCVISDMGFATGATDKLTHDRDTLDQPMSVKDQQQQHLLYRRLEQPQKSFSMELCRSPLPHDQHHHHIESDHIHLFGDGQQDPKTPVSMEMPPEPILGDDQQHHFHPDHLQPAESGQQQPKTPVSMELCSSDLLHDEHEQQLDSDLQPTESGQQQRVEHFSLAPDRVPQKSRGAMQKRSSAQAIAGPSRAHEQQQHLEYDQLQPAESGQQQPKTPVSMELCSSDLLHDEHEQQLDSDLQPTESGQQQRVEHFSLAPDRVPQKSRGAKQKRSSAQAIAGPSRAHEQQQHLESDQLQQTESGQQQPKTPVSMAPNHMPQKSRGPKEKKSSAQDFVLPGPSRAQRKRKLPEPEAASTPTEVLKTIKFIVSFKSGQLQSQPLPDDVTFKADRVLSPLQYFETFFSNNMFDLIVEQTNLYSCQTKGTSVNLSREDLRQFIAVELLMGIVKMPAYTDYWSQRWGYAPINSIMSLKFYQKIRSNLHFVNNLAEHADGYYKIRDFMELLRANCRQIPNESRQSIDETMVPYKGNKAGCKKQYVPSKPIKWGIKQFTRAGLSGMTYDFCIFDGPRTFHNVTFDKDEEHFNFSAKVVLALTKSINIDNPIVVFDNYFTSFELLNHLYVKHNIFALGTLRANRIQKTNIDLAKKCPRGTFVELVDATNNLFLVKWMDSKEVLVSSNFVGANPVGKIDRWDKVKRVKVAVDCPNIIKEYNKGMGGVDLSDMLVALHRTDFRTQKWYMRLFAQALDIAINNAWVLYKRDYFAIHGEQAGKTLKEFRLEVAAALTMSVIEYPPSPVTTKWALDRFDRVDHIPEFIKQRGRCKNCVKNKSVFVCLKCKVNLCLTADRNCFQEYHTPPDEL